MKIYIIGIGGIGVSALAQYYIEKGHEVSGSDLASSEITDMMQKKGARIVIGQSAENININIDLVVHTSAVKAGNAEYDKAKELGIKMLTYAEALGELTKEYYTIAIAGSHGKSTTTAMMALVLIKAGLDPTVIVGTKLREFGGSNFRSGKGKYLVIEACEYDSSFLHYQPKIIAVTNIDKEHLDYFKTFANVKKAFKDFMAKVPADGFLYYKKNLSASNKDFKKIKNVLKVPGRHNVFNAMAVLVVARHLGINDNLILEALSEFTGTWRRFEEIKPGIISDYAHHPNEVSATLQAAREKFANKKIWVIFEPHQHQRTHYLFNDFVKVFRKAKIDKIIITDIYDVAGREENEINKKTSSEKLVKKIGKKNVVYLPLIEAERLVKENIKPGDIVLIMGAGSIYKLAEKF